MSFWKKIFILFIISFLLVIPFDCSKNQKKVKKAKSKSMKKYVVQIIAQDYITGPEDFAIDSNGVLYTALDDGRIISIERDGSKFKTIANTKGRPLGIEIDRNEDLIVCDAKNGLLKINTKGKIEVLSNEHDGRPYKLTDDLDIAKDGKIYFTDASWKHSGNEIKKDFGQLNGRFLVYDPKTQKVKLLIDTLGFANGVAICPDQSYVLVAETWNHRIIRYWLSGKNKGKHDIFIEKVDGFPDNVTANSDGTYWLALANDSMLKLDKDGKIINKIVIGKNYPNVTSGLEFKDKLYIGIIKAKGIGIITL